MFIEFQCDYERGLRVFLNAGGEGTCTNMVVAIIQLPWGEGEGVISTVAYYGIMVSL